MIACRKCGSVTIEVQKHVFKNNTYHIKLLCKDCGYGNYIPRNQEAYIATKDLIWITDHSKKARRERECEYKRLRKSLRKNNSPIKGQLGLHLV